jgi:RNA polymerase sigma-70 factor (ECF subfamily)
MWPDSSETKELLKLAAGGDDQAASQLLERHRAPLRRAIHLRLDPAIGKRLDASDIVQDVLFEASRRLPEYLKNPSLPFHLWLRQISRDRLVDAHRRHRVAERRAIDRERPIDLPAFFDRSSIELAADLRDRELTPAAAAIRQELARRFHALLQQMEEEDRELLTMRYFEQLSNSDVARALGLSEAAAGMRHLRALRRLRALLAEAPSQAGMR